MDGSASLTGVPFWLQLLLDQFEILETMTPLDFVNIRCVKLYLCDAQFVNERSLFANEQNG